MAPEAEIPTMSVVDLERRAADLDLEVLEAEIFVAAQLDLD